MASFQCRDLGIVSGRIVLSAASRPTLAKNARMGHPRSDMGKERKDCGQGWATRQYVKHPEYKSLAPDGYPCGSDTHGLLRRYPVTASEFILIGKETERGWDQAEDIGTLLPSLKRYERNTGTANQLLRERLQKVSLDELERDTGLSRHTIMRALRGERVHPRSLHLLKIAICNVPLRKR